MNFEAILKKGYFPREIPHPFHSSIYGTVVLGGGASLPNEFTNIRNTSIATVHNLARSGALRRKLSIPNPTNFYRLAKFIVQNDAELIRHSRRSAISLTKPGSQTSPRAINPRCKLNKRPLERAKLHASSRFILKLPIRIEPTWISELRAFSFRLSKKCRNLICYVTLTQHLKWLRKNPMKTF
jgi:hypothetical protein